MLRQIANRQRTVLRGWFRTRFKRDFRNHAPDWWDTTLYPAEVSDRHTIAANKSLISTAYHYASIELLISRFLYNTGVDLTGMSVLDIGCGAGHWLDFYRGLGAAHCTGVDASHNAVAALQKKFQADPHVEAHQGFFQDHLEKADAQYDLINAIGVIFHVVDDQEWLRGLDAIAARLRPGGILIVGGYFGLLNNANIVFHEGFVVKRVRSRRNWKRQLAARGFQSAKVYGNRAFLFIRDPLPHSNLLIARR